MKFILNKFVVRCIFIACFVTEICCHPKEVQQSESKEINTQDYQNASLSVETPTLDIKSPLKTTKSNTIGTRRRRRKRRKKKTAVINQSIAVISTLAPTTTVSSYKLTDKASITTNKPRRRRIKLGRKSGKRKQNKKPLVTSSPSPTSINLKRIKNVTSYKTAVLETKSLILPVIPTPEFSSIKHTSGTTKKKKIKNTRCSKNNGGCAHLCLSKGEQKCQCFKGFKLAPDKRRCMDINECSTSIHGCQMNCTNIMGSYRCHCPRGLRLGLDSKSCEDVNECLLRNGHGPCQDTCENTYGGYKCNCNGLNGTKLGNNLHSCVDVDECLKENGGCSHVCINTFGRSFCSCPEEMELSLDFKTCQSSDFPRIF